MALSQITLEKGSYVQNCEVSYNSLIFEGFIQIQKPQGFDIFSGLSFASPLSLIFSPEHKGRVSVRYFVVPFSFQCLPSLCHFINSAAREQKKEKMKVREFKANPKLFKSKEKKSLLLLFIVSRILFSLPFPLVSTVKPDLTTD